MQPDPHNIVINKNSYGATADFNHYAYQQGRRLLRIRNKYEFIDYYLCANPKLITKEMLTPEIMLWLIDFGFSKLPDFLKVIPENEIPESVKIYAARKDNEGNILRWLKNPSTNIINTALKTAGQNLIYLQNPTKQQILLGLGHETESPWLITKIHKPTIQMQITIDYIKKPCESVKIAAAKVHGIEILRKVKNPSEQLLLTAIQHTLSTDKTYFLQYIPHPNNKISCAINTQIKSVKKLINSEHKPNQPEYHERLNAYSWPSDDKLSLGLQKIKQEMLSTPKDIFLIPTR